MPNPQNRPLQQQLSSRITSKSQCTQQRDDGINRTMTELLQPLPTQLQYPSSPASSGHSAMHFAMSPDSLFFFIYALTVSVTAAMTLFSLYQHFTHRRRHPAGDPEEPLQPRTVASSLIPAFMYDRLVRHSGKGSGSTECAVCLGVIQVGTMAKLLPACAHVYHVDCIDLWLASHSTCPLCRCRVGTVQLPPA